MENRFRNVLGEMERARRGLAIYAALVIVLTVACAFFAEPLLQRMVRLLGRKLVAYSPAEGFLALMSLALYCGITLSLPAGAWLLWSGAVSRWMPAWKGWGLPVVLIATGLFSSGIILGYRVLLPAGIGFLVSFETEKVSALISAQKFISFCGTMLLALGLSFEAPLISFFLARAGWLTPARFRKRWRHAILACTVMAAVLTPTPDLYNMTLMAVPLMGLYFVSFAVVVAVDMTRRPEPPPSPSP